MPDLELGNEDILIVTPHAEPTLRELRDLLSQTNTVRLLATNPVHVQGEQRGLWAKLYYYWFDPIATMLRLIPFIWRYRVIITYYHRHGYWLGLCRRLFNRDPRRKWVWIGFAPNPPSSGVRGWIKEHITRMAAEGHDLIICNTQPVADMIRQRFPAVARRVRYVRWGGKSDVPLDATVGDDGYVFCGGRTNRDFATVYKAVEEIGCPALFVAAKDVAFPTVVPPSIQIHRDIAEPRFYELLKKARIVVVPLKRADVSSGQVVLCSTMTYAKPVVAAATAGMEDYLEDGKDALLYEPGNVEDLKAKLTFLLEDADQRQALGRAARETYERTFNSSVFARGLYTAVAEVLPRRG